MHYRKGYGLETPVIAASCEAHRESRTRVKRPNPVPGFRSH